MEKTPVTSVDEELRRVREELARKERYIDTLKDHNAFLETLFDGIQEEIMVVDKDFAIREVNEAFCAQHGVSKDEVRGAKCYKIKGRGGGVPCQGKDRHCPLRKARGSGRRVEVTHFYRHRDGSDREMMRTMYPLSAGGAGPEYYLEITRDATDLRNVIRRLKASEKKFRAILDTANDAVLSVDENRAIVLFNNAAERIFGYGRREVLGADIDMLLPPQPGDHYARMAGFLKTRTPHLMGRTLSLTGRRRGGEEFPLELGLSYFERAGGATVSAIIRDVSVQKGLEKKLLRTERLAAVGQTVAHVAHEIKNPLMIIGGFSHQIRKSLSDEKSVRKVDMIMNEVSRLEKLVSNLGDFTKEYTLMKRPADINAVIDDVLKIMGGMSPESKCRFMADLDSRVGEIHCDPDKLKQVFMNVIGNGVEAMEDGGTIYINSEKVPGGVEIRIRDEGVGIGEEDRQHIFEPFYTTRKRGSGLGLSISYKIVAAHRGDIWAVSMPGQGTTFVIRIPDE